MESVKLFIVAIHERKYQTLASLLYSGKNSEGMGNIAQVRGVKFLNSFFKCADPEEILERQVNREIYFGFEKYSARGEAPSLSLCFTVPLS